MAENKIREIKITIPLPEELFSLFMPAGVHNHLRQAKKEALLALRTLIDSRIEALDKDKSRKAEVKKKIKIE